MKSKLLARDRSRPPTPIRPQIHTPPMPMAKLPTSSGIPVDPSKIRVSCTGSELMGLLGQSAVSNSKSAQHHQYVLKAILNFLRDTPHKNPLSQRLSLIHDTDVLDYCNLPRYLGLRFQCLAAVWELDGMYCQPAEIGLVPVVFTPAGSIPDGSLTFGTPILGNPRVGFLQAVLLQPTIERGGCLFILAETNIPNAPVYVRVPPSKRSDYWPAPFDPHLVAASQISPTLMGTSERLTIEGMMERAARCYEGPSATKRKRIPPSNERLLQAIVGNEESSEVLVPWPGNPVLSERCQLGDWLVQHEVSHQASTISPIVASFPLPLHWADPTIPEPPSDFLKFLNLDTSGSAATLQRKDRGIVSKSKSEACLRSPVRASSSTLLPCIPSDNTYYSDSSSPTTDLASSRFSTVTEDIELVDKKPTWNLFRRMRTKSTPTKQPKGKAKAPSLISPM
ncbi:hypothetical protein V5O48_015460 [Marasmius crinis-equi]|uniref:Uncharacterized protein n=1 Tax=Marasmius crinis-equi TaxID=585013 RepID=A0ABR3EUG5_9AGAR